MSERYDLDGIQIPDSPVRNGNGRGGDPFADPNFPSSPRGQNSVFSITEVEHAKVPNVLYVNVGQEFKGTLRITQNEIIFDSLEGCCELFRLPIKLVLSIEVPSSSKSTIVLRAKHFQSATFHFDSVDARKRVSDVIRDAVHTPALAFVPPMRTSGGTQGVWYVDSSQQYQRMGALENGWRISKVNSDFSLCESYPRFLCVPSSVEDETMISAAAYRGNGRIPILTYFYGPTKKVIMRCAQPKSGWTNAEDPSDQRIVQQVGAESKMRIFDLRPYINAVGNTMKGAGYEDAKKYHAEITFHNIPNIHFMAERYKALMETISSLSTVEHDAVMKTQYDWLQTLGLILETSMTVAACVREGTADCLVHCSDGWDRTSQVVSIAQILLDGHSRTIQGFLELVDKDWIQGGHKFVSRLGISEKGGKDSESSPVFLQFLDIVHQLVVQHPTFFEFDSSLLIFLADAMYSCRHVTFVHDKPKDLYNTVAKGSYPCVFQDVMSNVSEYKDYRYNERTATIPLQPCASPPGLVMWREYFHRYGRFAPKTNLLRRSDVHSPTIMTRRKDGVLPPPTPPRRQSMPSSEWGVGGVGTNSITSLKQCSTQCIATQTECIPHVMSSELLGRFGEDW
eukprot:PhF_6_TR18919/c0_g1_i1/m.27641/K18081/MTMR1_2; myotubularin-related protein 1/2